MSRSAPRSVLFVCTANSARSILAEAYLNHASDGSFTAHSAGSRPSGKVNPVAMELLKSKGISTGNLRSKGWNEFTAQDTKPIDIVITVCDNAANEACPHIPGLQCRAHWGVPDPAAADDERRWLAFEQAFSRLKLRIDDLLALPLDGMSVPQINQALAEIGRMHG